VIVVDDIINLKECLKQMLNANSEYSQMSSYLKSGSTKKEALQWLCLLQQSVESCSILCDSPLPNPSSAENSKNVMVQEHSTVLGKLLLHKH
jgi:hypothetical protein